MPKKLTIDEVNKRLPVGCVLLGEYNGSGIRHRFICPICKSEFETYPDSLFSGHTQSCGCALRKGTKHISETYFGNIKRSAIERKIDFNLTISYIDTLLIQQDFKCALSGLDIESGYMQGKSRKYRTASLDRIDNSIGYVEGNVQWVHKHINTMKNAHQQDYFIKLCKMITERNK